MSVQIPAAVALPIRATEKGAFSTTIVYTLEDVDGLFRRVSRDGRTGLSPGDGNVLAVIPDGNRMGEPVTGLAELKRWKFIERILLTECGVKELPF